MYDCHAIRNKKVEHKRMHFLNHLSLHPYPYQTQLDLDDLNVENAYFRSFEIVVRRQLDPNWHQVGPRTKQLVKDLGTLRDLLQ